MLVGDFSFSKTYVETLNKHILECKEMMDGFNKELKRASSKGDEQMVAYCNFWLKTWENTEKQLKEKLFDQ